MVEPLEHDHAQITLIDPARTLDDLMPIALTNRPELGSYQALVQAMVAQIRREKARPFLPSILINGFQTPYEMIQAGIFGLGPNSSLNQWRGRDDLSYQPLWQLEAFGLGNLARIKEQRGNESRAIIEFFKTQDMVAADVTRAQARVQSAAARVLQADRALRTAIITFNGNYEGLRADHPPRQCPGPGQPAAGGGLRPPASEAWPSTSTSPRSPSTTGLSSSSSTRWATRPASSRSSGHPARFCRWTRTGRPTCPRWATGRPRQPDERQPSTDQNDVASRLLCSRRVFDPCTNARS